MNAITATIRWVADFFDPSAPGSSMKRAVMLAGALTLCKVALTLAGSYAQALQSGHHASIGDAVLLAVATVPLASLSGAAYLLRKDGIQVGKSAETAATGTEEMPEEKP